MTHNETNSRNIGLISTVVVHIGMLLLFFAVTVWSPTEQKLLDFGVAVNYGTDEAGWGDNQTTTSPIAKIEAPSTVAKVQQQPLQDTHFEDFKPTPDTNEQVITSTDKDAPAVISTPPNQDTKPTNTTNNNPTPNNDALLDKPTDNQTSTGGGGNNGNVKGAVGDQGKPNGDVNADALLGNGGGIGGGASLDMAGWVWDEQPVINDKSAETGKIVFEIKIDEDGEVIAVKNVYCTVSRSVAATYEKAVYNLTFSPNVSGVAVPAVSTGRITFVITSK